MQGVRKRYPGAGVEVLRGIDLEIAEGEFASVVGRSGSGKTTLLNLIGGLDTSFEGEIEVGGGSLRGLPDAELAASAGCLWSPETQAIVPGPRLLIAGNACEKGAVEDAREVRAIAGQIDAILERTENFAAVTAREAFASPHADDVSDRPPRVALSPAARGKARDLTIEGLTTARGVPSSLQVVSIDMESFLRFPAVLAKTGLSRSTIYLKISRGEFPAPVKLGQRAVGWPETAIARWIAARIDAKSPTD